MKIIISFVLFITIGFQFGISQNHEYIFKTDELKKYSISEGLDNPDIVYVLEISTYNDPYLEKNFNDVDKLKSHLSKISKFKNLKKLIIYGDRIDTSFLLNFLSDIKKVEDVHILRSDKLNWNHFFTFLNTYNNLKYLKISQVDNLEITDDICNNNKLLSFALVDTRITFFSKDFSKLDNLENFSIDGTNLKSIPKTFVGLKSLKKVEIIDHPNFDFENSFKTLSKIETLTYLSLFSNEMKQLPDEIGMIKSLEELYLSNNNLNNLPLSLNNLTKLKRLNTSIGNSNLEVDEQFLKSFHLKRLENGNFVLPNLNR